MESIENARGDLKSYANDYILTLDRISCLIGNGRTVYAETIGNSFSSYLDIKIAEADYHDIVGSYGYLYGWILMIPLVLFSIYALKQYLRFPSYYNFGILFICFSFLFIGYSAGHCIANVMVAPIYAYFVGKITYLKRFIAVR